MKVKSNIGSLDSSVNLFAINNKRFPTVKENLDILLEENLVSRIPKKENWGNKYVYVVPEIGGDEGYSIYSMGPNGFDEKCNYDDICLRQ